MLSACCPASNKAEQIQFSHLNLCCLSIRVIDKVKPSFWFISQLYLDHNELFTLNGIEQFSNLEIFSFNFNQISNISQLHKIKNKFFMKEISFIGNPLQSHQNANISFLTVNLFNNLKKLNPPTEEKSNARAKTKPKSSHTISSASDDDLNLEDDTERYAAHHSFAVSSQKTKRQKRPKFEGSKKFVRSNIRTNSAQNIEQILLKKQENASTTAHRNLNRSLGTQYTFEKIARDREENLKINPFSPVLEISVSPQSIRNYTITSESHLTQSDQRSKLESSKKSSADESFYSFSSGHIQLTSLFLSDKKDQIASAFRARYLKEKILFYLKQNHENSRRRKANSIRKAWGAMKMFGILGSMPSVQQ